MRKSFYLLLASLVVIGLATSEQTSARGFGGFHGGGGGFHGGGMGGFHGAGGLSGAHFGGGGLAGSQLNNLRMSGANLGQSRFAQGLAGEARPADRFSGGGLTGAGSRLNSLGQGGFSGRPTRSSLNNFLGLPSDNGLHSLSGETQSRASQAYDRIRAGDGPRRNFIPGETQSPLSRAYDQIRAGDGPRRNFIPGETQSALSRLYDKARASNRPLRPIQPWRRHNNAVIIRRNFNNYFIFTPGWYRRYPAAWYPAAWVYGDAWTVASWAALAAWLDARGPAPVYYDYGNNIVYQDNSVYLNNQDIGTATQYYDQAQNLASQGSDEPADVGEKWMPLGVFALSDANQTAANMILELAVNKQGVVRGNYTNTATGQTLPVHGSVDKKTQRVAWTIGDNTSTVFETGLYNLTKDEAPALVHFGQDRTEQWLMVRLNQQDQQDQQDSSPPE